MPEQLKVLDLFSGIVSVASSSGLNEPECEPSRSAKSTRSVGASSRNTGPAFPAMTTSEHLPQIASKQMELPLMSSAAVSRVKISATPARAQAWLASAAAYGASTPELLGRFDPATRSLKTSQRCFIEGYQTFSSTFPRSGIVVAGTVFLPVQLERRTDETGCG